MKKPTQALIKKIIKRTKSFKLIEKDLKGLGFSVNTEGGNKYVFIHRKWKYVVKFVFESDEIPSKKNKISKYYLYPKKIGKISIPELNISHPTTILLQQKVEPVTDEICDEFYNKLSDQGIEWWDCHAGNMGKIGKKLVIIDY
jgi:hypothetical protein